MARNNVQGTKGHRFILSMSNGADPAVYNKVALVNTSVAPSFTLNLSEDTVADLDNFDAPFEIVREVLSRDMSIEAAGKVDQRYVADFIEYYEGNSAGEAMDLRLTMTGPTGFTITGPFYCPSFTIDATYKEFSTCSMSFSKAGELTFAKTI